MGKLLMIWIATIMTASANILQPRDFLQEISEQHMRRTRDTSADLDSYYSMVDDCSLVDLCEDTANYPTALAEKLIKQLGDKVKFLSKDELTEKKIALKTSGTEQRLCPSDVKIMYPRYGRNKNGKPRIILNQKVNPVQGFKVEICPPNPHYRSQIVNFVSGWKGECVQSYIYRRMAVIDNNQVITEEIKVPNTCSCYGVPSF